MKKIRYRRGVMGVNMIDLPDFDNFKKAWLRTYISVNFKALTVWGKTDCQESYHYLKNIYELKYHDRRSLDFYRNFLSYLGYPVNG